MPEALETTDMSCAVYQMSKLLKCDYGTLEDAFRLLFEKYYHAEMTYCTPLMVIEYAKLHGHSVYYLTSNTLVYKHVTDGHNNCHISKHWHFKVLMGMHTSINPRLPLQG